MSQQEIIDLAIASYLKTHDNTAKQYLKLRQDVLEVTQNIQKEVSENGSASAESTLKLEKLKFEAAKVSVSYKAYIESIDSNLENSGEAGQRSLLELTQKYDKLVQKKEKLDQNTEQLLKEHKPVVEKMRILSSRFETGISSRSRRTAPNTKISTERGSDPDENSEYLDFASAVFTKEELKEQLKDVESKLAYLRTVDEISNETEIDLSIQENAPTISLNKYLDELLQGGRFFHRLDDTHYKFDAIKSSTLELGTSRPVISDYENSVHLLTKDIQGIVARGTEAKERWIANAQKVEMFQALLSEDMEVDS